ncbi:MAG: cytidylate kinase-like family protein, partial [Syntrophales bacterium LBB04]|nr:cytidylate kinase-like family protein [Syntrophales bacterium LBB04]
SLHTPRCAHQGPASGERCGVDHGLKATEDLMEKRSMAITVSRQMGSGGTYTGYEVAKALGFSYVDREILRRAAVLLNSDEASLEEYEEKSSGFIESLLRTFALGTPETYTPKERPVYDRELFLLEGRMRRH